MLWIKALHVSFMVTWFAGLFYLPRLFVYHAMCDANDITSIERFKVMERKLYYGIMTPGLIFTALFGGWLLYDYAWQNFADAGWMQIKLASVIFLIGYHFHCGKLLKDFKHNRNTRSHVFYRWYNEVPVVFLFLIIILVVVKP